MFVDNVEIRVQAGNGGSGQASFRREKFLPFGGPDGGDGGRGGDIYLLADNDMEDLASFKHRTLYKAQNGGRGGKNRMHGLNAEDLVLKVPAGTIVYVREGVGELMIADLQQKGKKVLLAKGGKGGKGNVHYATATRKAPTIFQPGEEGEQHDIILKVRLLTDACLIGYPNSGKSSLIAAISAARPEVADYPFTTKEPVLGIVDDGERKYVWSEMPAIIGGAQEGKGLGNRFLVHAEKAAVMLYLLDATSPDIAGEFTNLKKEAMLFDQKLAEKQSLIAVNKIDEIEDPSALDSIKAELANVGWPVLMVSAVERQGLEELVRFVHELINEERLKTAEEDAPEVIFRPKPVGR